MQVTKTTRLLNDGHIYIGVFDQFIIKWFIYGTNCDLILV